MARIGLGCVLLTGASTAPRVRRVDGEWTAGGYERGCMMVLSSLLEDMRATMVMVNARAADGLCYALVPGKAVFLPNCLFP